MKGHNIESETPVIIDGTNITAGDVMAIVKDGTYPAPELTYDQLQYEIESLTEDQVESMRSHLAEKGVTNAEKRSAWSVLCTVSRLAIASSRRVTLEENFAVNSFSSRPLYSD